MGIKVALPVAKPPLSMPVTVAPVANSRLVSAFIVVPVIAAADAPPITAPSTVPPFISTVLLAVTDTGRVIQASLASFLSFRRFVVVSNQTSPADMEVAGADADV